MKKPFFTKSLVVVIFLGFALGFFVFAPKSNASFPGTRPPQINSGAIEPAIAWDEEWEAQLVCYATATGYACDIPANLNNGCTVCKVSP